MTGRDTRAMRQIPLELGAIDPPSFDNFVVGENAELVSALQAIARGDEGAARSLYLWGEAGSGKTHLLDALCTAAGASAIRLGPDAPPGRWHNEPEADSVVVVDDCDQLDAPAQQTLFHLYNRALAARCRFVAAGNQPPLALPLREDLRTRLGWGSVLRLRAPTDTDMAAALRLWTSGRGLKPPEDLIRYLLTHRVRDLRALLALLEALDRYALEHKRALTLPLLRELERPTPAGPPTQRC